MNQSTLSYPSPFRDDRGIALLAVLLLVLALSALLLGAAMVAMNSGLIRRYSERFSVVEHAALAGLEEARSQLNGTTGLYPDSGFATLENGVAVQDANGVVIPGLTRWTWAGPSGVSTGQFGVFGSIISRVRDAAGVEVVKRLEVNEESFAKFAYFTDNEASNICFGGGDQIFGPVHSNDDICIYSSGARFRDITRTARQIINPQFGTFDVGFEENVTSIPLPTASDLVKLQTQATLGGMAFTGSTAGATGTARTRIEFRAIDLNGDGDTTDEDEGFIRVYQASASNEGYVVAARPVSPQTILDVINCGDIKAGTGLHGPGMATFIRTASHPNSGTHAKQASLNDNTAKCYLGGDPVLTNGFQAVTPEGRGQWVAWGGTVDPRVTAAVGAEAPYLHPITRALNPSFKGVIFVTGRVAISGTVRSRVTLAATGDIIIADNIRQATDPALGVCEDILGLVAGGNVVVADNMINAPVQTNVSANNWKTMRPSGNIGNQDEFIHAVVLTMNQFLVQNHTTGPTNRERCETTNWGRGCLQLTGGIIQQTRGPVGTTAGTGNLKRYSYNTCAFTDPPPFFPTTGRFSRNRFFEMDPVGFDVAAWFNLYQQ